VLEWCEMLDKYFRQNSYYRGSTNFKPRKVTSVNDGDFLKFVISVRTGHCDYSPPGAIKPNYATAYEHNYTGLKNFYRIINTSFKIR